MSRLRQNRRMERADRTFFVWNAAVSTVAVAIIGYILGRDAAPGGSLDLSFVPALNATCNALASICLITGWVAIRRKAVQFHRLCMVTALAMSAIFLVGYLAYHYVHGDTKYAGDGIGRVIETQRQRDQVGAGHEKGLGVHAGIVPRGLVQARARRAQARSRSSMARL